MGSGSSRRVLTFSTSQRIFINPECERTLAWNDPDVNVDWRLEGAPIISAKDALSLPFERLKRSRDKHRN